MDLLLTLLPIFIVVVMLVVFRQPADISGAVGWFCVALVAMLVFDTSLEVIMRSTAAGFIRSFPVSLMVATSLLQMAYLEKTGALRRIVIFIKTIARNNRPVQIMMINIGFGSLMVAVGATPVSILPPILIGMGYSTYVAIALPAIGYDSLCTYALLGGPIVVFVDVANSFLKPQGMEITLRQAGMIFFAFLPLVSSLIGLCMLWIVGKCQAVREGWPHCLIVGVVIGIVSYFTNQHDNLVVLTGVACGIAVILVMLLVLALSGEKLIDRSVLTTEDVLHERGYSLLKALSPWLILVTLILTLNIPESVFNYLYKTLSMPVKGLTANGAPLDTRLLWQAYTCVLASTIISIPFMKPTSGQIVDSLRQWLKRAPRPVFAAAIFFAVGEIMNMSGFDMLTQTFAVPSMVKVLADRSSDLFQGTYPLVVAFIGLFGGFITGSEASTIAMFAKYSMATAQNLGMSLTGLIVVAAGLAFGGGLASVISPAKLQNAAAAIDSIGQETRVIRVAFVFSLLMTAVTSIYIVVLLQLIGN